MWIEVLYWWNSISGAFFLYPYLDDTNKTVKYFAFDTHEQKSLFEKLLKISWIWPKTWYTLTMTPPSLLKEAIDTGDISALTALPGIWAKTAKRIIVELQSKLETSLIFTQEQEKQKKNIIKTLHAMWYDKTRIAETLHTYTLPIQKDTLQDVILRVIQRL